MRTPLPPGTKIRFLGTDATVTEDDGGDDLLVMADGISQCWDWEMDGIECEVIK